MTEHSLAPLVVIKADITTLKVDAIVNAANERLSGGGGVDGAIHAAAGPELVALCRTLGGCPTGEARVTPGFDLHARFIVHTVGPIWHGGHDNEDELLASAYRNAFATAREAGARSVAFPAISTGVYGFPAERAATIAVYTLREELKKAPEMHVLLVAFSHESATILERVVEELHG